MNSIFLYLNYRTFLKDWYQEKKKRNPDFSYRLFARLAQFASPNFLKLVMEHQRNLSVSGIKKVSRALQLEEKESEFFTALVHFNQTVKKEEREHFFKKLSYFKEFQSVQTIEKENYEYFSVWYHAAIRELTLLPSFRENPAWIAKKLKGLVSEHDVKKSLQLLKKLGFIQRNQRGVWESTTKNISTDPEIMDMSITNFHHEMIRLADDAVDCEVAEKRDISSVTVAIDHKTFLEAKRRIQEFRRELNVLLSDCKKPDSVYQINFQFFSLSKNTWKIKS